MYVGALLYMVCVCACVCMCVCVCMCACMCVHVCRCSWDPDLVRAVFWRAAEMSRHGSSLPKKRTLTKHPVFIWNISGWLHGQNTGRPIQLRTKSSYSQMLPNVSFKISSLHTEQKGRCHHAWWRLYLHRREKIWPGACCRRKLHRLEPAMCTMWHCSHIIVCSNVSVTMFS